MYTLQTLQTTYPEFHYVSSQVSFEGTDLILSWEFECGEHSFKPSVRIHDVPLERTKQYSALITELAFNLGMVELLSYWKAFCSPIIRVSASELSSEQIQWWHKLLLNGLGEFFYTNNIDFTVPDFVTITSAQEKITHQPHFVAVSDEILLPIGGGKDSAVSAALLTQQDQHPVTAFVLNPTPASQGLIEAAQINSQVIASRTIDSHLLELNQQGYLNGHTPFSSYLAFLTLTVALIFDKKYIALSNESSANEGNATYKGHTINHQYTKTFEFEQDFREYYQTYLLNGIEYFSFLRPLNELQISHIFSQHEEFFPVFRSCNRGQKTNTWCHNCPKCLFAYLMLSVFIPEETLSTKIFSKNLFTESSLIEEAIQLISPEAQKPFECVGSYEESRVAFGVAIEKLQAENKPLPVVLEKVLETGLIPKNSTAQLQTKLTANSTEPNAIPDSMKKFQ